MRDTAAGGISVVNHDDVADLFPFVGTFTGDPDVSGVYLLMGEREVAAPTECAGRGIKNLILGINDAF